VLKQAIAVGCIIDCGMGAWLGHDGFQWYFIAAPCYDMQSDCNQIDPCAPRPGSGDYFHHLHHAHFECNYGAMHVPMDKVRTMHDAGMLSEA